ncbi:MAG: rRNA adenine dimethylase [Chitinivibrionales bacterium]|nr:rRNA adenine dimethylase [Chitinivibrionales bacterium]MBD3356473.1 rRNA adenine dimethylase [Chitinivibrionales bacterium]
MEQLTQKYAQKLALQGLTPPKEALIGFLDAELRWNQEDARIETLAPVFDHLNINALLFARPAEPFASIVDFLASRTRGPIRPNDTETRTFLHDIPVIDEFAALPIAEALKHRKSVIVRDRGIVTAGSVTPEQTFVSFSSICFACFVKFFYDFLAAGKRRFNDQQYLRVYQTAVASLPPARTFDATPAHGPFNTAEEIHRAMDEAGKLTVTYGLVDSYFGNVSYLRDNILYISQSGSSLDELAGHIDPCPLDGSSCAGITASSELSAHRRIVTGTEADAVLHGHPKFSVIMSMFCERSACAHNETCHLSCPHPRSVAGIPIVPGEVGVGPHGLCNTVPPALKNNPAAIVYGHGVFTTAVTDFNEALESLLSIENQCRNRYFTLIDET